MSLRFSAVLLISLMGAILVSACDSEPDNAQAAAGSEPLFMLSADGVGPLNGETPFNLVRIGEAFQDYNVAEEMHFLKGEKYPVITVKQRVKPLLSINPDFKREHIFSIVVHDNLVGNRLGHELGDKYSAIYSYENTEACAPGMEEWTGKVMCYAPGNQNILYLFSGDEIQGDTQTLKNVTPPPEIMAEWVLDAIIWKPRK